MSDRLAWRTIKGSRTGFLCVLIAAACSACGGGGDDSSLGGPPPTEPDISIGAATVTEGNAGDTSLQFSVTLSQSTTSAVSVDYATSDDSASAGSDYDALSGTLDFAAGATSQTLSVTVHGDTSVETDETLTVTLSLPVNATLAQASASGTILNDDVQPGLFGLDARPDNQTCIAPQRPTNDASVSVVDAFPNLPNIAQPTKMLLEPVADPRWFVLQKTGEVVTFDPDNATSVATYLTLSNLNTASEGGLLGMAFHPNYPATPEIFLSYTRNHSGPSMRSVISRFILDNVTTPGGGTVEQVILEVDQDFDNHNGGDIDFGPDGFLYIGFGDGGSAGDPNNRAQDTTYLLGTMLRIDVTGPGVSFPGNPYDIPSDNPFAGNAECGPANNANDCPEIFAWGLRNPWRWSFDPDTSQLWLADVGQGDREEVDIIELGGNYGWRCREGTLDFNTAGCGVGFVGPVSEYGRGDGNSITGGHVYRGSAIPQLIGRYVFADFGSGRVWALQSDGQGGYTNDELIDTNTGPTSFGIDENGELLFTDIDNSRLRRIEPVAVTPIDTIPDLLSATGCVDPADTTQPYSGLLPYDINAPFWSDGAIKSRFIGLPNGTTITRNGDGDWDFPNGTVIVKNFSLNGNVIETRHLMRHPDGVWAGYTYEWNAQGTDATRVRGGKTMNIAGQDWVFPSESQCMECHTSAAGFSLGVETAQLNRSFTYPATGRTANQLETIEHVLMFSSPLPGPVAGLATMPNPADTAADLAERARAYLHTNCAQCHRPGGPTQSLMDLRYDTALANMAACDTTPLLDDLGIANASLIAPGNSARSLVVERAGRRDSHGMPPLASNLIDVDGVSLLSAWIDGLPNCN